ncbi:MAG: TonB-dependent receptor [Acidobacteria bacterium]|nr:TonB-dependent receptor [Acidobacteriota bacterium]
MLVAWVCLATAGVRAQGSQSAAKDQAAADRKDEANGTPAASSGRIDESQLVGLPMNGRSYSQLATLQAGVSDPSSVSSSRGVSGGGLTVSGGRSTSNVFLMDGTNIMNTGNQAPRSAAGVQLGSDAALQVLVFGTSASAEYGRGSGGVLNSITRSGTPQFHATFFEFLRNSKLDARNFFDPGPEPTAFKRNQFGFTVTGPVVKDRTYFMGSYEGLRDRLSETDTSFFLDDLSRLGIIADKFGNEVRRIPVHPAVKPYLEFFPVANGPRLGGGTGENRATFHLPTNENFFTARMDHQMSQRDSLFGRYTLDDATSTSSGPVYLFSILNRTRQQYLTLVHSHIFSTTAVNSFRFGYTRPVDRAESVTEIEIPRSLFFAEGATQFGQISVPGLTTFGPQVTLPQANVMNTFQFADDFLLQKGRHGLKLGLEAQRYRWDVFSNWQQGGVWTFSGVESFLQGGLEGTTAEVALTGSDSSRAYRQTLTGLYLQDSFRVGQQVQMELGLRHEFTTLLGDKRGRDAYLADPLHDRTVAEGRLLQSNPSLRNVSPRVGVSWSPGANQNMVVRAGFGIYYDQLIAYLIDKRKNSAPFYRRAVRTNFNAASENLFPDAEGAVAGIPYHVDVFDYRGTTTPMVLRYNFSVQQELPGGWRTDLSYVGTRGNHLYRTYEANQFPAPQMRADGSLFFPANCDAKELEAKYRNPAFCRPGAGPMNPTFETMTILSSDAQSFYNSLRASASKRLGQGASLQASYTYSKSVDDASSITESAEQYGWDRTLERGLSNFDIRQRLVLNYFYNLPFGGGQRWGNAGLLFHLLGGWRIGGIVSWRQGTPFAPSIKVRTPGFLFAATRPNLIAGRDKNPVQGTTVGCGERRADGTLEIAAGQKLGTRELYYDPCVFQAPAPGTLGNTGRNTVIGPNVLTVDVSLQRDFVIDSKRRLQFRGEIFNVPNHTNFASLTANPATVFRGKSGSRNPTAGYNIHTATNSRQIQLALRLSF